MLKYLFVYVVEDDGPYCVCYKRLPQRPTGDEHNTQR